MKTRGPVNTNSGDLPDDRRIACWNSLEVIGHRQHRRADEERAQDHDHPGKGGGGIARLGFLEGRDAVGDGLDSGHRRTASGKGFQDQEERERFGSGYELEVEPIMGVVQEEKDLKTPTTISKRALAMKI